MWLTSHGVGARPWTSVGRRSHNRAGFNWLATRALPVHKNAGNNTSDVVRLSCVTMIRTDTTLDLSQKAEKGINIKKVCTRRRRFYEASKRRRREKQVQCEFASPRGKYWDIVGLAELKVRRGIAKQVAGTARPPGRVAPVVFLQLSDTSLPATQCLPHLGASVRRGQIYSCDPHVSLED